MAQYILSEVKPEECSPEVLKLSVKLVGSGDVEKYSMEEVLRSAMRQFPKVILLQKR